jgi:hypothetical protein
VERFVVLGFENCDEEDVVMLESAVEQKGGLIIRQSIVPARDNNHITPGRQRLMEQSSEYTEVSFKVPLPIERTNDGIARSLRFQDASANSTSDLGALEGPWNDAAILKTMPE